MGKSTILGISLMIKFTDALQVQHCDPRVLYVYEQLIYLQDLLPFNNEI